MLPATADILDRLAPRFVTMRDAIRHMTRQGYVYHRPSRTFARPNVVWRIAPATSTGRAGGRTHRLILKRT